MRGIVLAIALFGWLHMPHRRVVVPAPLPDMQLRQWDCRHHAELPWIQECINQEKVYI